MDTWVLALSEHERPSVYRDQSFSPPPSLKDSCKNIDHVITKFLSLPSTRSRCPWARSCCRRACWRWSSTSSSWGRQSFHLLHLLSTDFSSQSVRRTPSSGFLPWCGCFCPSWQNSLLTRAALSKVVEQLSFSFSVEIISLFYDHISQTLSLNFSQLERIFALDSLQQKFLLTDGFANVKIRLVCKCHIVGFTMKGFFSLEKVTFCHRQVI